MDAGQPIEQSALILLCQTCLRNITVSGNISAPFGEDEDVGRCVHQKGRWTPIDYIGLERGVVRVSRDGRRWYDPLWKARLVASCLEPGVSVSGQALAHGVNANLLRKWIKSFGEERVALGGGSPSGFIPVQICDRYVCAEEAEVGQMASGRRGRLGARGPVGFGAPLKMDASLPNGVRLTLKAGDSQGLVAIIGALSDVQAGR